MFPPIRHRLIIGIAVIIGAVSWAAVANLLRASDGSSGIVLLDAGVGPWLGVVVALGAALPTLLLALITSAAGNPLSGVFVVSGSLCLLAGLGGSIDGWFRRSSLPGGYAWLIVEMLIWAFGLVVVFVGINRFSPKVARSLPWLGTDQHLGGDTRFGIPGPQSILSGLVCAAIAAIWIYLTVRSTDGGQVIGSVMMGYLIGGFVSQMCFTQHNPVGILLSPCLVAIATYSYVYLKLDQPNQILSAWFDQSMLPSALALPIHYASAAVAGATVGIGMAQSFEAARAHAAMQAESAT